MPIVPMKACVYASYLLEQELACRRMERTKHEETPEGCEWRNVADVLRALRNVHIAAGCAQCGAALRNDGVRGDTFPSV